MVHIDFVHEMDGGYYEWVCDDCGMNAPFRYRNECQLGAEVHEIYAHWPLKTWQPTVERHLSEWYEICRAMRPRLTERAGSPGLRGAP